MSKFRFLIRAIILLLWLCGSSLAAQPVAIPGDPLTGLESSGFTRLTTHDELVAFLDALDARSRRLTVRSIGRSVEGRMLPMAILTDSREFGEDRSEKPILFIFAQQHGNEPSGKEAALILVRELAVGSLKHFLKHADFLIVPSVNPDGGEVGRRRNANNRDLNRNHVVLTEPEVIALHDVFHDWMPEVTLDVHEYNAVSRLWIENGFIKNAAEMLDRVSNLNIDGGIIDLSDILIPEVGLKIQDDGYSFLRYTVGAPFDGRRIRHSTTAVNDGRQSFGIYNTLSFIFEGKRYGDTLNRIEKRTRAQVSGLIAFIQTIIDHREEVVSTVHDARRKLLEAPTPEDVFIRMDYYPDPERRTIAFPVFDIASWKPVTKELDNYEPLVRVKKSVTRPVAYTFDPEEAGLIALLEKHRIRMHMLEDDIQAVVEEYTIKHITPDREEDKDAVYVDASVTRAKRWIPVDHVIVSLDQPAGNLIPLLLEPQSSYGITALPDDGSIHLQEALTAGAEYPILRVMEYDTTNIDPLE